MLVFVGLGLYDERSVTVRGRDAISEADHVVAEWYTSRLTGVDLERLSEFHDREITTLDRSAVEEHPVFLDMARNATVAFLVGGDPMISTTHVDLRLRAAELDIETCVVHGPSASSAASGLSGLQNYRFGKATTLPFPGTFEADLPPSIEATISDNLDRGLHTLVYLDLDENGIDALKGSTAAGVLAEAFSEQLAVVIARAGSERPVVQAATLDSLAKRSFGPPLHLLVIPGDLHPIEADALRKFADCPPELLPADG